MTQSHMITLLLEILASIGRYIRGQIIIASFNGLLAGIGFTLLHLPYAWLLGILVLLGSLIPFVGSLLGFVPALIIGWFHTHSGWSFVHIGLIWLVIQLLEMFVWQPWIFGQQLELHPLLVILVILVGGLFFGFIGVTMAVPLLAIIQIIFRYLRNARSN